MDRSPSNEQLRFRVVSSVWVGSALALGSAASSDVSSLDAGELGGAGWSLGVAHPTGFPLDMLLLRAWSLLPLGPIAFRQNLGVSLVGASVVSVLVYLGLQLAERCGLRGLWVAAAGGAVTSAVLLSSSTLLDAVLSVEVYATALLSVGAVATMLVSAHGPAARAAWVVVGLALGTHITATLWVAPLLLATWLRAGRAMHRGLGAQLVCVALGALVLTYLPLASARDSAFDWGDPETLLRWVRHVSAARIREAYVDALLTLDGSSAARLLEQLTEHALWLLPALLGAATCLRRQRALGLLLGLVLSLDLGYGSWINPMGVAQRQVGHGALAILALLAGLGAAFGVSWLATLNPRVGAAVAAAALSASVYAAGQPFLSISTDDGYAVVERYGAASPLVELPPRALYLCSSDSACASGLFAAYVEGSRPDLDVAPLQHLWEPGVVRRLRHLSLASAPDHDHWPQATERRAWAERRLAAVLAQRDRPVYRELFDTQPVRALELDLCHAPLVGFAPRPTRCEPGAVLDKLERARFGLAGPASAQTRALWASAHDTLGGVHLRRGEAQAAVVELRRALALTPTSAAVLSNLGVALEHAGNMQQALVHTARAVALDATRPTPWVNLVRLLLRLQGPQAARAALLNASELAVRDPRLDELERALDQGASATPEPSDAAANGGAGP